jgi:hypothetical protein
MAKKTGLNDRELQEILEAERQAIFAAVAQDDGTEEKWDSTMEEAAVLTPTPDRVARFPHPIPLTGLDAPLSWRIKSRLFDYFIVFVPLFLLDGLFHLTNVTRFFLGDLGLKPEGYQFIVTLSPGSWHVFAAQPAALLKILLFVSLVLFIYRFVLYFFARRTLGQLVTGTMLANHEGRYPSTKARIIKAVTSTLGDAVIIGTVIDLFFYLVVRPKMTVTDAVSGIRAVRHEDWAKLATRLLDRMIIIRREGLKS